jgi:RNA recognition motif-containing protein
LLVFFFPSLSLSLSFFSEQSLFCGHRRCNPKAFFCQIFWSSLEIFIFDFFPVSEVFGCFSRGAGEMTSMAGQPQFRYTQQPSKVLHVRNLPWECSEEELIELCKPFGKVVNTKVNVGANQNQAFIEFADLNQAIAMVSYYASSSEPAQVRGKTVYVQYSNRQEIVNSKNSGDVVSNVLLVTIEGVEAGDVSIDVLHLVSSTLPDTDLLVQKTTTFWCSDILMSGSSSGIRNYKSSKDLGKFGRQQV